MSKIPCISVVGNLMYAMVCSQPNSAHSIRVVSRFLANPDKEHWQVVKWILRYFKCTSNYVLSFDNKNVALEGYRDA